MNKFPNIVMSWHLLSSGGMPIGVFRVHTVPIVPLPGSTEQKLRPVKVRRVPLHPPRPRQAVVGPERVEMVALEDVASEASDDGAASDPEKEADDGANDEMDALLQELNEARPVIAVPENPPGAPMAEAMAALPEEGVIAEPGGAPAGPPGLAKAAPPPPPPPPQVEGDQRRRRATVTLQVPGGSISFYESKQAFEAVCDRREHGRCVVTRTRHGRAMGADGFPKSGRPVGFLAAWLGAGEHLQTKQQHWAQECFVRPYEERANVRAHIEACGPSGRLLLECERTRGDGEGAEPVYLEGYL